MTCVRVHVGLTSESESEFCSCNEWLQQVTFNPHVRVPEVTCQRSCAIGHMSEVMFQGPHVRGHVPRVTCLRLQT